MRSRITTANANAATAAPIKALSLLALTVVVDGEDAAHWDDEDAPSGPVALLGH